MPKSLPAFWSPTYARWLKLRSFKPPMSVLRPTLNELLDSVVVVLDDEVDFFEPQPAAATARAATSRASGMSLFTGPPTVLDCGAKTSGRFYFAPRGLRRAAGPGRAARGRGAKRPAAARRVARG